MAETRGGATGQGCGLAKADGRAYCYGVNFTSPSVVEQLINDLRYASWGRACNRAEINSLFNGAPPFTDQEVEQNRIAVNVNDLSSTHIDMAARSQFTNALVLPNPLVDIALDYGPVWKKSQWAGTITKHLNRLMKDSLAFQEEEESTFAQTVLHGIGPCNWSDRYSWCGEARGVEDILIPGDTLRSLKNLPFFAVYRSWSAPELSRMISGPKVDPGWNKTLAKRMLRWIDKESIRLMGTKYPDLWMPEKWAERIKEGGQYWLAQVPTVDVWDFYFWSDDDGQAGWKRRIVPDTWSLSGNATSAVMTQDRQRYGLNGKADFIYDSGSRNYADRLDEIIHFQFGDASAVAPFRYHTVRSLGFLMFAVCHLQNRLKCKIHDAVFENLLPYLRVNNPADAERALKVSLDNYAVIDPTVSFIPQNERIQINQNLAEMGLAINQQTMSQNSAPFMQRFDMHDENPNETATKTMAKMTASDALISSVIGRAYAYQKYKFKEMARRFCVADSRDPDVRKFRLCCLKAGVPEEALNVEAWDVTPTKVSGNGNKMMQMAIAEKMMAVRQLHAPEAQARILRSYDFAVTGDPDMANALNPDQPHISDTVHDSQLLAGTLMLGMPVTPKGGANPQEVIETLLHSMASVIKRIEGTGGMATPQEITGLQNIAAYIGQNIKQLAQDKTMKPKVKEYGDDLGKLMNLVKAYAQRLQEQAKKAQEQNGNGQIDPKDKAKVQAMMIQAQTKSKIQGEAHAQRTAERQIAFQQKIKQDAIKHHVEIKKKDIETAATVRRGGLKSFSNGDE